MKVALSHITEHLMAHNVKPSTQRIAIMKFLMENRVHPTVDIIYSGLKDEMPTLSRTTIYNTVRLLVENKAIVALDVDGKNTRFDYVECEHAHFFCKACGTIVDMELGDFSPVKNDKVHIDSINIYYKGLCNLCYKNRSRNKNIV